MAAKLISSFKGKWRPEKYKDTYEQELGALIKAKGQGKELVDETEPEEGESLDLMEALRQSIRGAGSGRNGHAKRRSNGRGSLQAIRSCSVTSRAPTLRGTRRTLGRSRR